jgi:hypothetical protein
MGWRRLAGLAIVGVVVPIAAAFLLLPLMVQGFVRAINGTVNASLWVAASLGSGTSAWTIVSTLGRAAAAAIVTPRALAAIAGLVLISVVALYGLQRLLGYEEESSR